MKAYLADVAVHAGLGAMFTCTAACTNHFCKHSMQKLYIGGVLILLEAAVTVPLVG